MIVIMIFNFFKKFFFHFFNFFFSMFHRIFFFFFFFFFVEEKKIHMTQRSCRGCTRESGLQIGGRVLRISSPSSKARLSRLLLLLASPVNVVGLLAGFVLVNEFLHHNSGVARGRGQRGGRESNGESSTNRD